MENYQKISMIQYNWEAGSLESMKKKYFERVINIFSIFEIIVEMDLVSSTFVDTKKKSYDSFIESSRYC